MGTLTSIFVGWGALIYIAEGALISNIFTNLVPYTDLGDLGVFRHLTSLL